MGLIYSLWEMGQSGRLDSVALSWGLMNREKFSKSGESVGGVLWREGVQAEKQ